MIYSALESTMRNAVEKAENINEDYSINWNFVDADAYAECAGTWKNSEMFYEAFDEIADSIKAKLYIRTIQLHNAMMQKFLSMAIQAAEPMAEMYSAV